MAISVAGGEFFIWKKPLSLTKWHVSTKPPKPDGTPRKTDTDSQMIGEVAAHVICGGMPPEGQRVYKLRSRLLAADALRAP